METKKRKPKTAVVAFAQALQEGNVKSEPKPEKKEQVPSKNFTLPIDETQLFKMPSGKKIRLISKTVPSNRCYVWKGNARLQDKVDNDELEKLKDSIRVQGQAVPILVRPCKETNNQYEVIYGSRRLNACQQLNIPIKVLEGDMEDKDALHFMLAENSFRDDITPYEKALVYKKWLQEGVFTSQEEIANKLALSRRWVNKVIGILKVPNEIISTIPSLRELNIANAEEIKKILATDADNMQLIIDEIKRHQSSEEDFKFNLILKSVKNKVLAKKNKTKLKNTEAEKTFHSSSGEIILSVLTSASGKITFKVNESLSPQIVAKLMEVVKKAVKKI